LEQNLVSSSSLNKKIKKKIKRTLILPVLLYCCETWSLTLRMEQRLRFFEKRMLRKMFGPESFVVNRKRKKDYMTRFMIFTPHQMSFGSQNEKE
jgi:hypothetical protein